jgi:hypothetical protein
MEKKQKTNPEFVKFVLKEESRLLPVQLTETEVRNAANDLANICQEIDTEISRQKFIKDQLKARITELEARRSGLALKVTRKEEYREVSVVVEMDGDGKVTGVRTDTGEIIEKRDATALERQLPMKKEPEAEPEK